MRYTITRKYNMKARLPENPAYETVDFHVIEAETPKEADETLQAWVEDWFAKEKAKYDANKTNEQKFEEGLEDHLISLKK